MEATFVHKLKRPIRERSNRVDLVPNLKEDSLISGPTFAEAGYVSLLTPEELMIFDGKDLQITVSKEAVLSGWRDKGSRGMWPIPLEPDKPPLKSKHVLLNEETEELVRNVINQKIVRYLHGCAGFPTKVSWTKPLKQETAT